MSLECHDFRRPRLLTALRTASSSSLISPRAEPPPSTSPGIVHFFRSPALESGGLLFLWKIISVFIVHAAHVRGSAFSLRQSLATHQKSKFVLNQSVERKKCFGLYLTIAVSHGYNRERQSPPGTGRTEQQYLTESRVNMRTGQLENNT